MKRRVSLRPQDREGPLTNQNVLMSNDKLHVNECTSEVLTRKKKKKYIGKRKMAAGKLGARRAHGKMTKTISRR